MQRHRHARETKKQSAVCGFEHPRCSQYFGPLSFGEIFLLCFHRLRLATNSFHLVSSPLTRLSFSSVILIRSAAIFLTLAGLLPESDRDEAGLRCRLEQPRLRVQRSGRNMAGHSPFRKGCRPGSEFPRRLYQPRQRPERGSHLRSVSLFP